MKLQPEQIFQLKLAAVDLATKAGATGADQLDQAQAIYDFITTDDSQTKKEAAVMELFAKKPSISEIRDSLDGA